MIFAKLIETSGFWVGVSIEEGTYVVFLGFWFFGLLGFEEIGFGGALEEGRGRLAGESRNVFMQNVISLLTFQLDGLPPH